MSRQLLAIHVNTVRTAHTLQHSVCVYRFRHYYVKLIVIELVGRCNVLMHQGEECSGHHEFGATVNVQLVLLPLLLLLFCFAALVAVMPRDLFNFYCCVLYAQFSPQLSCTFIRKPCIN